MSRRFCPVFIGLFPTSTGFGYGFFPFFFRRKYLSQFDPMYP